MEKLSLIFVICLLAAGCAEQQIVPADPGKAVLGGGCARNPGVSEEDYQACLKTNDDFSGEGRVRVPSPVTKQTSPVHKKAKPVRIASKSQPKKKVAEPKKMAQKPKAQSASVKPQPKPARPEPKQNVGPYNQPGISPPGGASGPQPWPGLAPQVPTMYAPALVQMPQMNCRTQEKMLLRVANQTDYLVEVRGPLEPISCRGRSVLQRLVSKGQPVVANVIPPRSTSYFIFRSDGVSEHTLVDFDVYIDFGFNVPARWLGYIEWEFQVPIARFSDMNWIDVTDYKIIRG